MVHNHGPEEGEGLACRETRDITGKLRGACLDKEATMTNPAVTVYSKTPCVQCTAVKRLMNKRGIDYTLVDVTKDPAALAYIQGLGYTAVPVTVVDTSTQPVHWYGFVPDLIKLHFAEAA